MIRRLLASYFDIVRKKIIDSIPKAVTLTLVSRVQEELHDAIVADLYNEEVVESLLAENAEVVSRRKRCREVWNSLVYAYLSTSCQGDCSTRVLNKGH